MGGLICDLLSGICNGFFFIYLIRIHLISFLGTDEERGIHVWRKLDTPSTENSETEHSALSCYDFPFGMSAIRKIKFLKYIPISPTFTGFKKCGSSNKVELNEVR